MDGKLIQQVLINLLDNALKHTRPQEEITLTLRREQNEAVFTVQDEGEGIAEKDLEHIFQTFLYDAHTPGGCTAWHWSGLADLRVDRTGASRNDQRPQPD